MYSIVMPYYKNHDIVERSIRSILQQKITDFELIIVDDGSEDGVESIIDQLNDDRIRLITQKNQGVSAARNNAIKNSKGEWICFLDSDDEWLPDHLQEIAEMQQKYPEVRMFVTSHRREGKNIVDSNNALPDSFSSVFMTHDFLRLLFQYKGIIHTNSVCLKKELIDQCGYFAEGVNKGEDTDLWYRCSLFTDVAISKKVTTIYHRDNSFLTKEKNFNYDWIFLKRQEVFFRDEYIDPDRKYSMKLICQSYELSAAQRYISEGKKEKARLLLTKAKSDLCPELKKKYRIVRFLFSMPQFLAAYLTSRIYERKKKKY